MTTRPVDLLPNTRPIFHFAIGINTTYLGTMNIETTHLLQAIKSKIEIIAVWGAYQILQLEDSEIEAFLPAFLSSRFVDIQDAGITSIAELGLKTHSADIIRFFEKPRGN